MGGHIDHVRRGPRVMKGLCDRVGHGCWCVDSMIRYRAARLSSVHVTSYSDSVIARSLRAGVTCSSIARPIKSGPEPHKVARTRKCTSRSSRITHHALCVTITPLPLDAITCHEESGSHYQGPSEEHPLANSRHCQNVGH